MSKKELESQPSKQFTSTCSGPLLTEPEEPYLGKMEKRKKKTKKRESVGKACESPLTSNSSNVSTLSGKGQEWFLRSNGVRWIERQKCHL